MGDSSFLRDFHFITKIIISNLVTNDISHSLINILALTK